uniref:Expressed protein n=1 Tax=Schizophyllum commune (strain H4-8 / FGSC 9210) TaxID=578458 RepID=D8Q951_SCHCM
MSSTLSLSVEDSSPLISYNPEGAWKDGDESAAEPYSGQSFHYTAYKNASASVTFNGTGISIYGANGPDYGPYTIYVDNVLVGAGNGKAYSTQTKALLGTVSDLDQGEHTVELINNSDGLLDIDWVVLSTDLKSDGVSVGHEDSGVEYHPSSEWKSTDDGHTTSSEVAYASLTFYGDAVAVYGTASSDNTRVQALVDGDAFPMPVTNTTDLSTSHNGVLLYFLTGLPTSEHSLKIAADPSSSGKTLAIDAIHIYSSSGSASVANWKPASTSHELPLGIILGAAVGGGVFALVLLFLLVQFLRKRHKQRAHAGSDEESPNPGLPIVAESPSSVFKPMMRSFSMRTKSHSRWSDETLAAKWHWKKEKAKGKGKAAKDKVKRGTKKSEKSEKERSGSFSADANLTPLPRMRAFSPDSTTTLSSYASNAPMLYPGHTSPSSASFGGNMTPATATFEAPTTFQADQYTRQLTLTTLTALSRRPTSAGETTTHAPVLIYVPYLTVIYSQLDSVCIDIAYRCPGILASARRVGGDCLLPTSVRGTHG